MTYHTPIFTNKEIRKHFSKKELPYLQLMWIKGKPARTKGKAVRKGDIVTVYGSDFIAKIRIYKHVVINN